MACIRSQTKNAERCVLVQSALVIAPLSRRRHMERRGGRQRYPQMRRSRDELFITTKVWITNGGYEKAKESLKESLHKLQTEYIDLVLIHQPFNDYYGTYRAMEEAYKEGWIRAIGVSNFYPDRLVDLCSFVEVKPAINQVETHIFQQQKAAHEYMEKYGVQHESWGPFAEGRKDFFTNSVLNQIGRKHGAKAPHRLLCVSFCKAMLW